MDGDHDNTGMRKNSIGALLSGARHNDDDGPDDVPHHESKPRAKSSLIEDLQNMDQGFDFSSMGTMGDFSGWGFGDSDVGSKNDDNDDDGGGGGWNRRNNRGGGRDNRGRGVGGRDRGDRDGGGRGGGRGGRGGRDRDGGGRDRDGRNQSRDRGNRRDSFNNDSWKQNDDDDDRNDDGGWKKPNRERGGGGGGGGGGSSGGGAGKDRGNIKKPGDWTCGACGFDNFASRSQCFDCGADKSNNKGGGGGGGGRRDSGFEDRGNFGNMAGGNASSLGKRNLPEEEPQPEPEKRSKLDADIYGPPMITSWTDIKEYDDDHDAQMFTEENQYLAQRFGEGVVRVRYTNQGVVGYYCMICDVEMTGEKPLDLHCNGMKHLKKKEKRDNPTPEPMQNQKKDKGSGSRPRLLPPEAFGREGGNDRDRDRGKDRDRQNRNNRSRFDDDSYDNRGGRGNMGRNRDRDNFGGSGGGGGGGGNWNQGNNRNDYGGNDNFNNRNRGDLLHIKSNVYMLRTSLVYTFGGM
ncbi:uncharacterized protein DDB_G0290685-like [Macrobrachium nipponense]|uniref:uncharacterized protein DDB_G0290685-like n=1 Tax=Macrobrachium nipponense TaxID=159736 RepID=UPI0030C8A361